MKKAFLTAFLILSALLMAGAARVACAPVASVPGGIYENVDSLTVELEGDGAQIHYTLDGSAPSESSPVYSEPIVLDKTSVIRAICYNSGCAPSRISTYNYILNEGHTLPVLCLNVDTPSSFMSRYYGGLKGTENAAVLTLYEDGALVFSRACGVDLRGGAALSDAKKSLGVWFRKSYGDGKLRNLDLFGDGKGDFKSLVIRSGQDYHGSIIRDSLFTELCRQMGDSVPAQHSKYCILYINGSYFGIHCLKEHMNRSYFAEEDDVAKDDVQIVKASNTNGWIYANEDFNTAMKSKYDYAEFSTRFDIDNLVDYLIIEGYCGNWDLKENIRFYKSPAHEGKWRAYFFDADKAFYERSHAFRNILEDGGNAAYPVTGMYTTLLKNEEFASRFTARYHELLQTVLSDENVLAEIEKQSELLSPEVERDFERWGLKPSQWQACVDTLRGIKKKDGEPDYSEYTLTILRKYLN